MRLFNKDQIEDKFMHLNGDRAPGLKLILGFHLPSVEDRTGDKFLSDKFKVSTCSVIDFKPGTGFCP